MVKRVLLVFVMLIAVSLFVNAASCNEGDTRPCGEYSEGECKQGLQYCTNGKWGFCMGQVLPEEEICDDGKDNDCNGYIDEGCECEYGENKSCSPGDYEEIGICKFGVEFCDEDGEWSGVCLNYTEPGVEKCGAHGYGNELDDNCDGYVDESCKEKYTGIELHCTNRIKDEDEEGIDCGGSSCDECNDCTNGVLEKDEKKTSVDLGGGFVSDCGGLNCPDCPSCNDGLKNQGEEDVDCGGPCGLPCKSGGEEDVDDDGLTLEVELQKGTDPNRYDTDNDGIGDARDAMPLCPNSFCDVTYGENEDTCEEDCKSATGSGVLLVVLIIVLILAAIVGFFYFQYKSSSKVLSDEGGMRWKGFGDSGSGGESGEKRGSTKHRSMMIQHKGRRSYERHKERKEKESDVEQKLRESIETFEQVRRR